MLPSRRSLVAAAIAWIGLLLAPGLPGLPAARVLAHAQLVASSPAAGSVLPSSPEELRLVFSEPLEAQVTSLDLARADGTKVLTRAGGVDGDDPYALVVPDPGLEDGVYTLTWRTLSAADGHTAEGFLSFAIGDDATVVPSGAGHSQHNQSDPIGVLGRWLTYAGVMGAVGLAAFALVVQRTRALAAEMRRLVATGLAVAAVATLVVALASALESGAVVDYLAASRNGTLQVARVAVTAAGAAAVLRLPGRAATIAAAVAGLAGIGLLVVAGHASAIPGPTAIAAGVVHVVAVAVWLGGVAGLVLVVMRPAWFPAGARESLRTLVPRFSAIALVSIGFVVATGAYAAWVQTGSLLPAGTDYGRTLVMKSALAVAAIGLGAFNYFDGGRMRSWLGGMGTRLRIEAMLGAAVLLMSAALATTPPVDEPLGIEIAPVPDAFGEVTPGVSMEVVPGRPGINRIAVRTNAAMAGVTMELGLDRLDGGGSTRVPLVLEGMEGMADMPGMNHSGMISADPDGRITRNADALVLPAESSWDANVRVVGTDGTELSRQRFTFALTDDGISEGRAESWLTWGTLIAGALVVGGAVGLGLGLGGMSLPRCEAFASRVALVGGGAVGVLLGGLIGAGQLLG